jgi:hypothetical protein
MLPLTVGIAGDNHPQAQFSGSPVGCIGNNEDAWEKFDGPLNTLLQKPQEELQALCCIGEKGLIGFHWFLEYLVVHHSIEGALLEGKLGQLMEAMDNECITLLWNLIRNAHNLDRLPISEGLYNNNSINSIPVSDNETLSADIGEIIDIDNIPEVEKISPVMIESIIDVNNILDLLMELSKTPVWKKSCSGIVVKIPKGRVLTEHTHLASMTRSGTHGIIL